MTRMRVCDLVYSMQAFTAEYNLYVMDVEAGGGPVKVGPDGSRDQEQVGVPDWVYEGLCSSVHASMRGRVHVLITRVYTFMNAHTEEMLESDHAVWWSPDGGSLLYVEFNDVSVPRYSFPWYGREEDLYPDIERIAYPKVHMCEWYKWYSVALLSLYIDVLWYTTNCVVLKSALIQPLNTYWLYQ